MTRVLRQLRDGGLACALLWSSALPAASGADIAEPVAASFDCAGAPGIDERVICADALLRGLDAELNRRYRALLDDARGDSKAVALRADERAWIIQRNNECRVFKGLTIGTDAMPNYVDCFIAAYEERLADFERLTARPGSDPQAISNPIRRSLYAQSKEGSSVTEPALVDTGIVPAYVGDGALEFKEDGTLLVLGSRGTPARTGLYEWGAGGQVTVRQELTTDVALSHRLCSAPGSVALLPRKPGADVLMTGPSGARPVAMAEVPDKLRLACGLSSGRTLYGARQSSKALDMGPVDWSTAGASERYATLVDGAGGKPTSPPLRIDRRYRQMATYSRLAGGFVVYAGHRPKEIRSIALRRWAKSGCDPYWIVDDESAQVRQHCVPYGAYANDTLNLLPTRDAMYFAAGPAGLYRIEGDAGQILDKQPAYGATVAPDGCAIAFITAANRKEANTARVMVFRTCH